MKRFFQQLRIAFRRLRYPGDGAYWERRYAKGGNSGTGSSGVLATYKAEIVNRFVESMVSRVSSNWVVEMVSNSGWPATLPISDWTSLHR